MSSANPKVHEPSMEEILASIRRIISDDQDGGRGSLPRPVIGLYHASGDPAEEQEAEVEQARQQEAEKPNLIEDHGPGGTSTNSSTRRQSAAHQEKAVLPLREHQAVDVQPIGQSSAVEALLSDSVSASVSSAFGRLEPKVQIGSSQTLEDIVREMLRPMLKAWLDENLEPLVERLVQAEIERITRARR